MTTARLNVLHDARQSQNPAPRSALSLFNLDRWVFSSLDDPADQIMVMVVITEKANGGGGCVDETIDDFSFTDNSEVASVSDCVNHPKDQKKLFMLTLTPGWCKACVRFQLEKQPL